MEYVSSLEVVKNKTIKVDTSGINNSQSQSKIIRIALLTPNLGKGINNISDLNPSEIVWSTKPIEKITVNNSYEVIYVNENLNPWKLIIKK